jgi:CBS domain-containing protein
MKSKTATKSCQDVMTKNPSCVKPSDTIERAARLMRDEDVGPLPVVQDEASRKLVGILTDRDIVIRIVAEGRDPRTTRVEEIMATSPVTCQPEDELTRALDLMSEHQVRRIPVVDKAGAVVGIIAQADVATRTRDDEKTGEIVREVSR